MKKDKVASLEASIGLLMCLLLTGFCVILMLITNDLYLNIIYLICMMTIIIITYFTNLLTSIVVNMIFIAAQILVMMWQYQKYGANTNFSIAFWLVLPMMISIAAFYMTKGQVNLQRENNDMRLEIVEHGHFDIITHLRTMRSYLEDMNIFIETNRRFKIPVTTIIIRIKYFEDLKNMMSERQFGELIRVGSQTFKEATRDNDVTYILNQNDLTWADLLFSEKIGAQIVAERIRQKFDENIRKNTLLASFAINLELGIAQWDAKEMKNYNDLMQAALKEIQYDK